MNLSSPDELSTEYVSDELLKRHGDTVWRLRLGRRHVYLLVLLVFQSEDDHWMALRTLTYSGLLYQELVRNRAPVVAAERLPAVLPVVLYNGNKPWTATREMRALVAPTGPWLAPYQPAQRYWLLDLPTGGGGGSALPQPAAGCGTPAAEPLAVGLGAGSARVAALATASGRGGVAARVRGLDTAR